MLFPNLSGFANLTPLAACLILAPVIMVIAYGLISSQPASASGENQSTKGGDLGTYLRIVERIHVGEGYYEAAESELIAQSSSLNGSPS